MSDFFQSGVVATFHRLQSDIQNLENDLLEFSQDNGITLILPSLFSEIQGPGLEKIIDELLNVKYIREIAFSLGPASKGQFREVKKFLKRLPQKVTIIWNTGPRIQALYDELSENKLSAGPDGKGRSAWMALGYILAEKGSDVVCLHDCDIITYDRELLGRLVYPVASPNLEFEFCKGFYSRVTNKMHGRVSRLFVIPLVRALQSIVGFIPILRYFDSFRYPLAGEFAMTSELAVLNRIPSDWGLEIGVLAEVYRNAALSRICQSELCANYDHKHQELSPDDQTKGLNKMAVDIAKTLLRTLTSEGIVFQRGFMNSLWASYRRIAQDMITRYNGDAAINGLNYDRHEEESAVDVFAEAIKTAGEIIAKDPLGPPAIPNWARVFSAIHDFDEKLLDAVKLDNRD
jgi:glucosyl-3-phosphoglycerate synthase